MEDAQKRRDIQDIQTTGQEMRKVYERAGVKFKWMVLGMLQVCGISLSPLSSLLYSFSVLPSPFNDFGMHETLNSLPPLADPPEHRHLHRHPKDVQSASRADDGRRVPLVRRSHDERSVFRSAGAVWGGG